MGKILPQSMKGQKQMIKEPIQIIALFGESGVGKDALQNLILKQCPTYNKLISYTSRPKRDYEIDGKDYHFVTSECFKKMIKQNKILEYTKFNDWFYGTSINNLKNNTINVGVFNIQGINSMITCFKSKINITPIRVYTSDKTRLLRALEREENPNCKEICRRFLSDLIDFEKIPFNYITFKNEKDNLEENWNNFKQQVNLN